MNASHEITTSAQFTAWLSSTPGGESVIYHSGFLARDTSDGQDVRLVTLAHAVWEAAVAGRVYLTQGSLGDGSWAYIATAPLKGTKVRERFAPDRPDVVDHRAEYQKARRERLQGKMEFHRENHP
jgi:hypothetical protein